MRRRRRCVFDGGSCGMTGVRGCQIYNDGDYSREKRKKKHNYLSADQLGRIWKESFFLQLLPLPLNCVLLT